MRDRDALLAELDQIAVALAEADRLRARRVEIVQTLRAGPDPVPVKELAERLGVTSGAISQMTAAGKR